MFKWGDTYLRVKVGSYSGPFPALNVQELDLIPAGADTPASAIQTGGRLRKRATMTILLDTYEEYDELYNDHLNSTIRYLELKDSITIPLAMISGIDPPKENDPWIEIGIQFMEV